MFRVNREIFCLSGCHFPVSSITENGKDFLRYRVETAVSGVILVKAGRKALCRIYISRKRKQDAKTGSRWTSSWQRIIFRKVFVQTGKSGGRKREEVCSHKEQVSTTVPKSASLRFCPSRETCWGVPSPNPACRPRGLHIIHFRASPKVHSFRRSSSPHATRFAGLAQGPHERRPRKEVTPCERNTTRPTAAAL